MLETSLEGFSRCWRLLWRDFHGAGDFLGGILTVLETSRIFKVLDTSYGDFFRGISTVLETSLGDFHNAGDFYSWCWRLLREIFTVHSPWQKIKIPLYLKTYVLKIPLFYY